MLAATLYSGNLDRNNKLRNIKINGEIYTPYAGGMLLHILVRNGPNCICGSLYFKLSGIDVINIITDMELVSERILSMINYHCQFHYRQKRDRHSGSNTNVDI